MQTAIFSLHYLPCLAYFSAWTKSDSVLIDAGEHYQKQTYRNRTQILTAQGILNLIIPIKGNGGQEDGKTEGQGNGLLPFGVGGLGAIDYSKKWIDLHLRSIRTAYGKAPFFTYFFEEFAEIYQTKYEFLADFNIQLLTVCQKILQLKPTPEISQNYIEHIENQNVIDYRQLIHPKRNIPKHLEDSLKPYTQVFGKSFAPNLSILDLIFCEGINAQKYI